MADDRSIEKRLEDIEGLLAQFVELAGMQAQIAPADQ